MASDRRKREWFRRGAEDFAGLRPQLYPAGTYVCPICRAPFAEEALDDKSLSVEHVPPESLGGAELLLTCTHCNNTAGTLLDADAKKQEDVRLAMMGQSDRPHKVKAIIGDLVLNGQLVAMDAKYSLHVPRKINRPGTSVELQLRAKAGVQITVENERYSILGARISYLRSAYLALFAMQGYAIVLDAATDIVRKQILECDERRMETFVAEAEVKFPPTVRRVFQVLDPDWHRGWTVQFGRYLVQLPSLGDMTFYERLAANGLPPQVRTTTYKYMGWPAEPTYGL